MMANEMRHFWKGYYRNRLSYSPKYCDKKDFIAFGRSARFSELLPAYGSKRMTGSFALTNGEEGEMFMHVVFQDFFNPFFWNADEIELCRKFYYKDSQILKSPNLERRLTTCDVCGKQKTTIWDRSFVPPLYYRLFDSNPSIDRRVRLCFDDCLNKFSIIDTILTLKLGEWCGVPYVMNKKTIEKANVYQLKRTLKRTKMTASRLLRQKIGEKMSSDDLNNLVDVAGDFSNNVFDFDSMKEVFLKSLIRLPCQIAGGSDDDDDAENDSERVKKASQINDDHLRAIALKCEENLNEFVNICNDNYLDLKPTLINF